MFGERKIQFLSNIPGALSWLVLIFANSNGALYTSRLMVGFFGGIMLPLQPIYIAEISLSDLRGRLLSIAVLTQPIGSLLCYALGSLVSWRMLGVAGLFLAVTEFILMWFCPESPVWLLQCQKEVEAKRSLQWLRGDQLDIELELAAMKENVEKSREVNKFTLILSRQYLKPIILVLGIFFFLQFNGSPAMVAFVILIFQEADITFIPFTSEADIVGLNLVLVGILIFFIVDKVGRRKLFLTSNAITALTQLGLALCVYLQLSHYAVPGYIPYLLFQAFISGSQLYVANVLIGELLPTYIRAPAAGIIVGTSGLFVFAVLELFLPLSEATYYCGGFLFFGCSSILCFIFTFLLLPETKGRSLEELEEGFA